MTTLGGRIRSARRQMGLTQKQIADAFGISRVNVTQWESDTTKPDLSKIADLARALGVTPDWLLGSKDGGPAAIEAKKPEIIRVSHVHVRGNVQAGIWAEFDEFPDVPVEHVPIVPGRWSHLEQFAYRVHGPSVNKLRIFDGDYVICVPYWQAKDAFVSGDIVVAERRRPGGTERTIKQIEIDQAGVCRLWPRSDDPRFQVPIPCDGPEPDGTEIEVIGLVIGSFTPR